MPLPNLPGVVNNLRINPLEVQVQDQFDLRVDQLFSQQDTMFARYTYGRADITYPDTPVIQNGVINPLAFAQGNTIAGSLALNHAPSQQATLQETHQFTPNLSNQLAFGYTRFYLHVVALNEGFNIASRLGLQGAIPAPTLQGCLRSPYPASRAMTRGAYPKLSRRIHGSSTIPCFYTRGAHLLRFGFSAIQNRFGFFQLASPSGALDFSGTYTASPSGSGGGGFADFLLGLPDTAGKSSLPQGTPYERYGEYGAFVQDQWHATKRLSVSLGLRYDLLLQCRSAKTASPISCSIPAPSCWPAETASRRASWRCKSMTSARASASPIASAKKLLSVLLTGCSTSMNKAPVVLRACSLITRSQRSTRLRAVRRCLA